MKKFFSILLFSFFIYHASFSQDYLGIANSNFAGVNGIDVNPASIVNNPRKWDVTIIGLNLMVANNFFGLNSAGRKYVLSRNPAPFDMKSSTVMNSNGKPVSVFFGTNIMLPSFMFSRPKHKDAFAFTIRTRVYANVDGIPSTLADIAINGQNDSALFNQDLSAAKISAQIMAWNEYGITYGKTIMETNNERLNVAGRLKYLQGIAAMYLYVKNLNYNFYSKDSIGVQSSTIHYGHSTNLEFNQQSAKFTTGGKPMFGLDLGATYEFHKLTDVRSREKSESKYTPLMREYKYKIGFSIQDLGWIKYLKPADARDFTAQLQSNMNFNSLQSSGTTPLGGADDSLKLRFKMDPNDTKFRMTLPTLMSVQGDYYAGKNIYVNSTFNYAFQMQNFESKIHEVTTFSITPRRDWKWIGTYVPFSYNKYSHVRAGFTLRLGPLIIGTADLLPLILKTKTIKGLDFHFMLKVPHIHFRKHDKSPRSRSKFDVNREKEPKRKKDKSHMPKKDVAPQEEKYKQREKKKKEYEVPDVNREKKTRKHIFPHLHLFKKKHRHTGGGMEEKTIYFKL